MKDMYGKEVINGDFLAEGHEEYCYFFVVIDEKPCLIARWGTGVLERYTVNHIEESDKKIKVAIEAGKAPSFMKDYFSTEAKRMITMETKSLCKVEDFSKDVLIKFIREGHEGISYSMETNDKTFLTTLTASFPDGDMVNVS